MKMCEIAIQKLEDQYKSSRQKLIDEFEDTKGVIKIRISKKNMYRQQLYNSFHPRFLVGFVLFDI